MFEVVCLYDFGGQGGSHPELFYKKVFVKSFAKFTVNVSAGVSFIRSSHRRCSVRKGVLKNFAKLTGKHLCQSLFFNKVVGLRPANFIKIDSGAGVFL